MHCFYMITCVVVCVFLAEDGGSAGYVGDLELLSFSKCAGSAWHALRLLSSCYRLLLAIACGAPSGVSSFH